MAIKSNPKLIGIFVLGALALLIVGIVAVGGGKLWRKTIPVVMYFPRSVAGLNVGAPVTFRGVKLGEVTDIFIGYQASTQDVVITVFANVYPDSIVDIASSSGRSHPAHDGSILRDYIKNRGLRAQLSVSSLVTGQLAINLDFYPYAELQEETDVFPDRIELPTVPSTLEAVQSTLQEVYRKFSQLPLEDMINDVRQLLQGANRLVNSPKVEQVLDTATATLGKFDQVAGTLDKQVGPLLTQASGAVESARAAFAAIDARAGDARSLIVQGNKAMADAVIALNTLQQVLASANSLIQPGSQLNYELVTALRDLGAAARSINALANTLDRNPNAVIFGRTPPDGRRQ